MNDKMTVQQVAKELGYSVEHTRWLLRAGAIRGETFNRVWIIDRAEVERVKKEQTDGGYFYHGKTAGA